MITHKQINSIGLSLGSEI